MKTSTDITIELLRELSVQFGTFGGNRRFNKDAFADVSEWANWVQSRSRHYVSHIDAHIAHIAQLEKTDTVMVPSEDQVKAAAMVLSETPLIDAPKLPFPCWMGLAREVLAAAQKKQKK